MPKTGKEAAFHRRVNQLAELTAIGSSVRAISQLMVILTVTFPTMIVQWIALKFSPFCSRILPLWYHRCICRILGIRIHIDGQIMQDRPVLVVSNHVSWIDIPILSAVAPVSFIAKSEISSWPLISLLAKLQRSLFINRERKTDVGRVSSEMTKRFAYGDILVLFAEGTTSDGNRVRPFRSALMSSAFPKISLDAQNALNENYVEPTVQTLSLVYTHIHGVPLGREGRKIVAWYGEMNVVNHIWQLLKMGPIDVKISIGRPISIGAYHDRKKLAQSTEQQVRARVVQILYGG